MYNLIETIGFNVLTSILQLLIGGVLSLPIYLLLDKRIEKINSIIPVKYLFIAFFAILGMILPLNAFGYIPIIVALLFVGFHFYQLLPIVISNAIFTILVPNNDVTFVWRTGMKRVVLAFVAGFLAGIVLKIIFRNEKSVLRSKVISALALKPAKPRDVITAATNAISTLGLYIIIGTAFNAVFHKYIWWHFLDFIYTNSRTSSLPLFFAGFNVVNPFFLLAIDLLGVLMNFSLFAALCAILKPKGLAMYFAYLIALTALLSSSMFFY